MAPPARKEASETTINSLILGMVLSGFGVLVCIFCASMWFILFCISFIVCALMYNEWTEDARLAIICPNQNCKYRGRGKASGGSSGCLLLILLLMGILPGIIYLLFCGTSGVICPKCGMRVR